MAIPARTGPVSHAPRRIRCRAVVRGTVQGVGFRPFVYERATAFGLAGWVANCTEGVIVEVEGGAHDVGQLLAQIRNAPPPNARIVGIETCELAACGEETFSIRPSVVAGVRSAQVPPDLATCQACLAEVFDPADRRYLYPFTNCTRCGPRYSIIEEIPYDRARTSMRSFEMCADCRAEYENPHDRRFHAEPNACAACGPRLALWTPDGRVRSESHDALLEAAQAIRDGRIVAVKGIGGFQLFADARDEDVVDRLRLRKRRPEKPFALMFASLAQVRDRCRVAPEEEALLCGTERPIVLLTRSGGRIAAAVAPGRHTLGVMLPYSPLHYILMRELGFPVVATSGNVADEPIVIDEREALRRLAGSADLYLVHDRPIVRPVDDSVARVVCGREMLLRRARGYAPAPVRVDGVSEGVLAVGGHLKTTIALTIDGSVILSQHIGDQGAVAAREAHARAITDLARLHAVEPRLAVHDLHADYSTTRCAQALGIPTMSVQHHVAHVAACIAEHGMKLPVLGVAWDGSGYGGDGAVWGGEFLQVDGSGWRRVACLRPFRLPGGEAAVREPRRAAVGMLFEAFGESAFERVNLAPIAALSPVERDILRTMLRRGINAPFASSAGRLFDAFAALTGLQQRASFEGQAAARLEEAAAGRVTTRRYTLEIRNTAPTEARKAPLLMVDWQPALEAALADLAAGLDAGAVSAALHSGLATAIAEIALRVGEHHVALTGGCFQNARLTEAAVAALRAAGFEVVWHRRIPPNDGGLALGQAVWAAWVGQQGALRCV